ncbi:MAG: hypothetical protein MSC31_16930 [Solirubrobacteraceae bacterium MAG38_C4-C5]|nr:hypothetical protein [Candidatus Siliceabacter maunaloa]
MLKRRTQASADARSERGRELVRAAGEFLPVAAVGADGTVVLEDGSLVHIVACQPPNQDSMDSEGVERAFWSLRALAARLERGQVLQMQIEGELLDIADHLAYYRAQVEALHGFDPGEVSDREASTLGDGERARWALYKMLGESVARSAPEGFTMRRRCYLIVRYRPDFDLDPALADALPGWVPGSRARRGGEVDAMKPVRSRTLREHRRVAQRATTRVRGFMAHLARDGVGGRLLDGSEVLRYLSTRFNPTSTTWGRLEADAGWEGVLSRFDSPLEREEAQQAATRLHEQVARSPMDFRRDVHHGEIEQDMVRVGYLGGSPASTRMFWLRELLQQPLPFTLTVYLHGLARTQVQDEINRAWHQAQRENERRIGRGRRDAESERQEREQGALVEEMADDPQAGLIETSMYLMLRVAGPRPKQTDLSDLDLAAHQAGQVVHRATAGGVLMPGTREQDVLWRSTLPLGMDVARKTLRFGMEHAADSTALIGASCGSPTGLPLLQSTTGEVEFLDPFDRAHRNHSIVVAGTSGTGKTHFGNRLLAHLVALGARGYVFDRAGHYEVLSQLIPGARKLDIGSAQSRYAINHWDTPDPANPPNSKITFLVELHRVMLDVDFTRQQEAVLAHCIRSVYRHCAHHQIVPRESELVAFMRAFAEHDRQQHGSDAIVQAMEALAAELSEFVDQGIYAHLWDRETDIPDDAPLLIFDSSGAQDKMLIPLMFATMEWVRERVQRDNQHAATEVVDGARLHGRSVLLLDEGWAWSQVEELAQHIQHWARQSRHYGTCFVVMSQDASDFEGTSNAVLRNASIKILFEQDKAMLRYLADTVDVSDEVISQLKDLATVKGQYSEALLLNGGRGSGRVKLIVGPHEYWAFTSEPSYDRPLRQRAIAAREGNVWAALHDLAAREGIPAADPVMTA